LYSNTLSCIQAITISNMPRQSQGRTWALGQSVATCTYVTVTLAGGQSIRHKPQQRFSSSSCLVRLCSTDSIIRTRCTVAVARGAVYVIAVEKWCGCSMHTQAQLQIESRQQRGIVGSNLSMVSAFFSVCEAEIAAGSVEL